jgi:hypothetical protein
MKRLASITLLLLILGCTSKNSESTDTVTLTPGKPADPVDYLTEGMGLVRDEEFEGIKTGLSSDDILKLFGGAESKSKVSASEADGMNWQTWFYPRKGFEISFYQNEDKSWEAGRYLLQENATLKSTRGLVLAPPPKK